MKDDTNTKAQAEALLTEYYKEQKLKGEPNLLSWNLHDNGTMVLVDGASGRKLTFEPKKAKAKPKAEAKAEAKPKGKDK